MIAAASCRRVADRSVRYACGCVQRVHGVRSNSVAILAAVAASLVIVVNAVFLQSGAHPAPFFADPTKPPVRAVAICRAKAPTLIAAVRHNDPIADLIGPSPRITALQQALSDFGFGQIKPTGRSTRRPARRSRSSSARTNCRSPGSLRACGARARRHDRAPARITAFAAAAGSSHIWRATSARRDDAPQIRALGGRLSAPVQIEGAFACRAPARRRGSGRRLHPHLPARRHVRFVRSRAAKRV